MSDTSTIGGKVRYVLEHLPEAKENWHVCARSVWTIFYVHHFQGFPYDVPVIRMTDLHKIPTITAIRREWRKQVRAAAVRMPEKPPYYSDMP